MNKILNKYRLGGICIALVLAVFAVYGQVLHYSFVDLDDSVYVTENEEVKAGLTGRSILWAFGEPHASFWHPLTWLSHMLDCELFGLNPAGHHLTSLMLHIANTLLLFWVLMEMSGAVWQSAFVAGAFAMHPLHVESVAWVSERKDVLSTLFWMLTMAGYVRYARLGGAKWYVVTLFLFSLGLLAKPMLVTLPLVLLLLDYWPLHRLVRVTSHESRAAILEKLPFFALSAIFSIVAFFAQQGAGTLCEEFPARIRFANAFVSYVKYIQKTFWPVGLGVFYPHPGDKLPMWQAAGALLLLVGVSAWVIYSAPKRKYLFVGWLWYIVTLVPVIGFVQVGSFAMADRYTYLPLIGIFIMISWGLPDVPGGLWQRRFVPAASAAIVLSALAVCAYFQAGFWRNTSTLFEHTIAVTSKNWLVYYNLGTRCNRAGRLTEAVELYKESIKAQPGYADAHYNLGLAYIGLGHRAEAAESFKQAVRVKPDFLDAYCNLGLVCIELGRNAEAIEIFKQAIRIKPDCSEAFFNLGLAYANLGRYEQAKEAGETAIRIKPDYAAAHYNLGVTYILTGNRVSALKEYDVLKTLDAKMAENLIKRINK